MVAEPFWEGIGSELSGGSFWDGVRDGVISSGLNHTAHTILMNSAEISDKKYEGLSDMKKSKYIKLPKTALVETVERNTVNTITPGGIGVHVQNKDIIRIIGKRVWVKDQLNTVRQTSIQSLDQQTLYNGWRTATWEVYSYYTSSWQAMARDLSGLLNTANQGFQWDYSSPEAYPGGYLSPYLRQFRLGGFTH